MLVFLWDGASARVKGVATSARTISIAYTRRGIYQRKKAGAGLDTLKSKRAQRANERGRVLSLRASAWIWWPTRKGRFELAYITNSSPERGFGSAGRAGMGVVVVEPAPGHQRGARREARGSSSTCPRAARRRASCWLTRAGRRGRARAPRTC
eukprot:694924-Prorocentrum_minimum.AAC.1